MPRRVAACLLLKDCFDQLGRLAGDWLAAPHDEALHQLRIGLRRFRVLLRVFGEDTESHGGKTLRAALARLGDKLGAVRDFDVMMELAASRSAHGQAHDQRLIALMRQKQAACFQAVWRFMNGSGWPRTLARGQRFLQRLDADPHKEEGETVEAFFGREYRKHVRRIRKAADMAMAEDPQTLHALRIILRRLRYLGELLDDVAGDRQRKTISRVHSVEQRLGRVHDIDMALAFLDAHPAVDQPVLRGILAEGRARRLDQFRRKWPKCLRAL